MDQNTDLAHTVLVLAPTFNDSTIAVEVLSKAHIKAIACLSLEDLCHRLSQNHGAIIISEEVIIDSDLAHLELIIRSQPAWSDLPIILPTSNVVVNTVETFAKSGNISLLEKPFSRLTLIRTVEVALRARRRQYEVRDLLIELNLAKEEAERANMSKSQFLANMSHEIRTPIGAILGFTDLLKNPSNLPEENLNYMGIVERNSHQLLRLIDDILDLSKVEAGKMTFESIQFSLIELLADFSSVMSFKASEKGIRFQFSNNSEFPETITSDPVRLKQILTNIVGNAIKFTDRGRVEVHVSYKNSTLQFLIKDTGVGISEKQKELIFQPFSQADTSTTRKFGGTGLGLVLSRKLAETLGGRLDLVSSTSADGSIFVVEITAPTTSSVRLVGKDSLTLKSTTTFVQTSRKLQGLKVLLIEDTLDNQMLISTYLKNEGALVKSANNGAEGMIFALKENFDLLLMDIQMPVLDGHEATRQLRKSRYSKPIIALTAHAMREEQEKCFKSGFTEFLSKPIQRNQLIEVLSRYLNPTK